MPKGVFFIVEGIDGSGKTSAVHAIRDWARSKNLSILDVKEHCQQGRIPGEDEIAEADIIFTSEPTYFFVGKAIREELIVPGRAYPPRTLANAYALDREMLYKRIIIPARKRGKLIVQERGLPSTIAYQPVQEKLRVEDLMRIDGNKLAMDHPPDLLLILRVPADEALARVNGRFSQKKSIFDNLIFQRAIAERYESVWMRTLFERVGTRVVYFDAGKGASVDQNKANAQRLFTEVAGGSLKQKETQQRL